MGIGDDTDRAIQTVVTLGGATARGGSQVRMTFTDSDRQVILMEEGSVWTCGSGEDGLLGHDNLFDLWIQMRIDPAAFGNARMVFVTGNEEHSFAVSTEGILFSLGTDGYHMGGPPPRPTPMPVEASLAPGACIGRSCGLPHQHALAFCMGTHAHLGAGARHRAAPSELLKAVQKSASTGTTRTWARGSCACLQCASAKTQRAVRAPGASI